MPFQNKWVGRGSSYCDKIKGVEADDEYWFLLRSYFFVCSPVKQTVDSFAVVEWMLMRDASVQDAGKHAGHITITGTERNIQRVAEAVIVSKVGLMVRAMKEFTAVHVNRKLIMIGNVIGSNRRTQ